MADSYVVVGSSDLSRDGTSEVILERDKNGDVKKSISTTQPAELSKANQDTLKNLGIEVRKVSADEAQDLAQSSAGADIAGQAPLLDNPDND